jgi:hypothetical protein
MASLVYYQIAMLLQRVAHRPDQDRNIIEGLKACRCHRLKVAGDALPPRAPTGCVTSINWPSFVEDRLFSTYVLRNTTVTDLVEGTHYAVPNVMYRALGIIQNSGIAIVTDAAVGLVKGMD